MSKKFIINGIDTTAKELTIIGPEDCSLGIQIDYDDVDHPQVGKDARKLCRILNEHWNDKTPVRSRKKKLPEGDNSADGFGCYPVTP